MTVSHCSGWLVFFSRGFNVGLIKIHRSGLELEGPEAQEDGGHS